VRERVSEISTETVAHMLVLISTPIGAYNPQSRVQLLRDRHSTLRSLILSMSRLISSAVTVLRPHNDKYEAVFMFAVFEAIYRTIKTFPQTSRLTATSMTKANTTTVTT
jgi:hypothetical protein